MVCTHHSSSVYRQSSATVPYIDDTYTVYGSGNELCVYCDHKKDRCTFRMYV